LGLPNDHGQSIPKKETDDYKRGVSVMKRPTVKREPKLPSLPDFYPIINDDGSLLQKAKPVRQPINGLDSIVGDLDATEATVQGRLQEKKELDAKLVELETLIRQTRPVIGLQK
jgi:hypothetical protein